jgi:ribosomal protein S18 acetylase RimI-like enzyme
MTTFDDSRGQRPLIRLAEPRDKARLGQLGAALVRLHYAFDRDRFMAPQSGVEDGYAWFLGEQMNNPDAVVFVAEQREAVVGYVYASLEPRSWNELRESAGFIHDVVVDESARGNGIGTQLIEAAARWLEVKGAPRIMLWSAEQNSSGQRLFERLGFRRTMVEMTRERA